MPEFGPLRWSPRPRRGIIGSVPSSASLPARQAARRESVTLLRVVSATAAYAAGQLANGLSPQQARVAALEAAAEMEQAASVLRALTLARLTPAERRRLAVQLVASGTSQREAARQVDVSPRRVWDYLRDRS